jgi:hypothetical protein
MRGEEVWGPRGGAEGGIERVRRVGLASGGASRALWRGGQAALILRRALRIAGMLVGKAVPSLGSSESSKQSQGRSIGGHAGPSEEFVAAKPA